MKPSRLLVLACLVQLSLLATPRPASAWGTEGDMIIALVADHLLQAHDPAVQKRVAAILATDTVDDWTKTDIAHEAVWADMLVEKAPRGGRRPRSGIISSSTPQVPISPGPAMATPICRR